MKLIATTACRTAAALSTPSASPRRSSGGRPGRGAVCTLHCRSCNSRNLNTNPLCDLTDTAGTRPWARAVREEYNESSIPDYIASLEDQYRKLYPNDEARTAEILTEKANVDTEYDAYKEDIAIINIYFGKSTAIGENIAFVFFSNKTCRVRDELKDDGV